MAKHKKKPKTPNAVIATAVTRPAQQTARETASPGKKDNSPNHSQSMEQQRAVFALEQVSKVVANNDTAKRFKAYANSTPAMIQTSGLGQSLAFAKAKSNGKGPEAAGWKAIYEALNGWLTQQNIWPDSEKDSDVLALLINGDQMQYRRAQAEAQALLVWLKQFARADIAGEE